MRKLLGLTLAVIFVLSLVSTAVAKEPEANILESTNIINVTGAFDGDTGTPIVLALVDENDNVKYIQSTELERDCTYRVKFKYDGDDLDTLKLRVNQGGNDITDTVVSAIAEKEAISFRVNMTTAEGKTMLDAQTENFYNVPGKTYIVMLAYYGENNELIDVFVDNTKTVENDKVIVPITELSVPEGVKEAKAFVWENTQTMIPLARERKADTEEVSVLMVGHSFVDDSRSLLKDIAAADGVNITFEWATYGGGGFKEHWNCWNPESVETQEEAWEIDDQKGLKRGTTPFRRHYHGSVKEGGGGYYGDEFVENMKEFKHTIDDIIAMHDYDYVVMVTLDGVLDPDTYEGSADDIAGQNMAKYMREKLPDAEIVLFNTWAYEKGSTGHLFKGYGSGTTFDQQKMWAGIRKIDQYICDKWATLKTDDGLPVALDGKTIKYLPSGQAFMNARQNPMFDTTYIYGYTNQAAGNFPFVDQDPDSTVRTLHRDSYHGSYHYGRYLAGLVWYGCFTGNSVINNKYVSPNYPIAEEEKMVLKEAAQKAIDDTGFWN